MRTERFDFIHSLPLRNRKSARRKPQSAGIFATVLLQASRPRRSMSCAASGVNQVKHALSLQNIGRHFPVTEIPPVCCWHRPAKYAQWAMEIDAIALQFEKLMPPQPDQSTANVAGNPYAPPNAIGRAS